MTVCFVTAKLRAEESISSMHTGRLTRHPILNQLIVVRTSLGNGSFRAFVRRSVAAESASPRMRDRGSRELEDQLER